MNYAENIKIKLLEVQEALEEENNGKWEAKRESENMKKQLLKVQKEREEEKIDVMGFQTELVDTNWQRKRVKMHWKR